MNSETVKTVTIAKLANHVHVTRTQGELRKRNTKDVFHLTNRKLSQFYSDNAAIVQEHVGCCKPGYTMPTDCPAKREIRKVP